MISSFSKNLIENAGIKKTISIADNSDINLIFVDKFTHIKEFNKYEKKIIVQSKIDKFKKIQSKRIEFYISSKKGTGIDSLLRELLIKLTKKGKIHNMTISRERHIECLKKTREYLEKSKQKKNYDVFSEDIRLAIKEISKIYGKVDIENILDIIFNDFCIGK